MVPSSSFLILGIDSKFFHVEIGMNWWRRAVGDVVCRILAVIIKKRIPRSGEASITESVDRKTVILCSLPHLLRILLCFGLQSNSGEGGPYSFDCPHDLFSSRSGRNDSEN